MTAIKLRAWPGLESWEQPKPAGSVKPPAALGMVIYCAGDGDAVGEHPGIGAALVFRGRTVIHRVLLIPDDFAKAPYENWASPGPAVQQAELGQQYEPLSGEGWIIATHREFFDPRATMESAPWAFAPHAYSGARPVYGYDLGRTFGLWAEHYTARTGTHTGEWTFWPPGWGTSVGRGRINKVSPHRPPLLAHARRVGWSVGFAPMPKGQGKTIAATGRNWRGCFVDLASLSYALTADRGARYEDYCRQFGLPSKPLPWSIPSDVAGADAVAEAIDGLHSLVLATTKAAGQWLPGEGYYLHHLQSPAGLADRLLDLSGLPQLLGRFGLTDDDLAPWQEAFHGGWVHAAPEFLAELPKRGELPKRTPVVACDISSAYPLTFELLGGWATLTAKRLCLDDVTEELRQALALVAADPTAALDPELWGRMGLTVALVAPEGLPFVVTLPGADDDKSAVVPLFSERPLHYAWPDLAAAAALSGKVPTIVSAKRYRPVGKTYGLSIDFLPGLSLDLSSSPVRALVEHRRRAKAAGDPLAGVLHAVTNSLVWGNFCRYDDFWDKEPKLHQAERPGPWAFPPIASTVTAGARLLLAVMDRLVTDAGGQVIYRDTDSSFVAGLTGDVVATVVAKFDPLARSASWPVWKTVYGIETVIFGPKRHVELRDGAVINATEANLGGAYLAPPTLDLRGPDGWAWSRSVAELAAGASEDLPWAHSPPALRPVRPTTRAELDMLPGPLGARPGSVVHAASTARGTQVYRAQHMGRGAPGREQCPDCGKQCRSERQYSGHVALCARFPAVRGNAPLGQWFAGDGRSVYVATDVEVADEGGVLLETLDDRADRWRTPSTFRAPKAVWATEYHMSGRVSPAIDRFLRGY